MNAGAKKKNDGKEGMDSQKGQKEGKEKIKGSRKGAIGLGGSLVIISRGLIGAYCIASPRWGKWRKTMNSFCACRRFSPIITREP